MPICPDCGAEVNESDVECPECGAQLINLLGDEEANDTEDYQEDGVSFEFEDYSPVDDMWDYSVRESIPYPDSGAAEYNGVYGSLDFNVEAQFSIGVCYYDGLGVKQDFAQAAMWFVKSAEKGYISAQCLLGECYAKGTGVERNMTTVIAWWKHASDLGNVAAQYQIGVC